MYTGDVGVMVSTVFGRGIVLMLVIKVLLIIIYLFPSFGVVVLPLCRRWITLWSCWITLWSSWL